MILISPFSRRLRNGKSCPKDYPYWKEVIHILKRDNLEVIQLGINGEEDLGATARMFNLTFKELIDLTMKCDTWISVDNFFQHLVYPYGKRGIVLFGPSNPAIFGYPININLYKDEKEFRPNQFEWYNETPCLNFVDVKTVIDTVIQVLRRD